jgi:hypothetical protein
MRQRSHVVGGERGGAVTKRTRNSKAKVRVMALACPILILILLKLDFPSYLLEE